MKVKAKKDQDDFLIAELKKIAALQQVFGCHETAVFRSYNLKLV